MSNTITFVGTLGKNGTVANLTGGGSVLKCTVANDTGFGNNKKTNWFNVSMFGKRAEGRLVDFLKKGQQVYVSGELSLREYIENGQTRYSLDVIATTIDLVGKKGNGGGQGSNLPPVEAYEEEY